MRETKKETRSHKAVYDQVQTRTWNGWGHINNLCTPRSHNPVLRQVQTLDAVTGYLGSNLCATIMHLGEMLKNRRFLARQKPLVFERSQAGRFFFLINLSTPSPKYFYRSHHSLTKAEKKRIKRGGDASQITEVREYSESYQEYYYFSQRESSVTGGYRKRKELSLACLRVCIVWNPARSLRSFSAPS